MDSAELDQLADRFAALSRRYGPVFGSWGGWERGEQYLRGLFVGADDRRNAENLAEHVDGATPRGLERFLSEAPWSAERVIEYLQEDVAPLLEEPDAVFVVDETLYLTNAPPEVPLLLLGQVASRRWTIETGFEQTKGEVGLDEYE
ncbi:MAG: transposase, partial [Chloroflexi bacterium]|nr:transposase [Chloroflexota bacterium]